MGRVDYSQNNPSNIYEDYQRITKDTHLSKGFIGKLKQLVRSVVSKVLSSIGGNKKKEQNSVLIQEKYAHLQGKINLYDQESVIADSQNISKLQMSLTRVRADIKALRAFQGKVKSPEQGMQLSGIIDELETLERTLFNAIADFDEEKLGSTQSFLQYFRNLETVRNIQFPGRSPGFLKITAGTEEILQGLVSGDPIYSKEIVPLLRHFDALSEIVEVWEKFPEYKNRSGFTEAQVSLIEGFVSTLKEETSIFALDTLCSTNPHLFLTEAELIDLAKKASSNPENLTQVEKRTLQLLLLQYSKENGLRIPGLFLENFKTWAKKSLQVKEETSFTEVRDCFRKDFFPLTKENDQISDDILFEIYYSLQSKFFEMHSELRMKRILQERKSVVDHAAQQEIRYEKHLEEVEVHDGTKIMVPDEISAWGTQGYKVFVRGKEIDASSSKSVAEAMIGLAGEEGEKDPDYIKALLSVAGMGSIPDSFIKLGKVFDIFRRDMGKNISEKFGESAVDFLREEDGSVRVTSRFVYGIDDSKISPKSGSQEQKVIVEQTFILKKVDGRWVKTELTETVDIQLSMMGSYIEKLSVDELSEAQIEEIARQILRNLINDDRYSFDAVTRESYHTLSHLLSQNAFSIIFGTLRNQYLDQAKKVVADLIEYIKKGYKNPKESSGFLEEFITEDLAQLSKEEGRLSRKMSVDLHRHAGDIYSYVDQKSRRTSLVGKDEDAFFKELSAVATSEWVKPISRFYSQFISNQTIFSLITDGNNAGAMLPPISVFGNDSYFLFNHDHCEITVTDLFEDEKVIEIVDYVKVGLKENHLSSGIEFPEIKLAGRARLHVKKITAEDGKVSFVAEDCSFRIENGTEAIKVF